MSATISATSAANQAQNAALGQTLNQADFLQLLVTQMSSQDPLDPQSDTAFAAQLAQFSALQQSQDMEQNMSALQATSMIGETVSASPSDGSAPVSGLVTSVVIQSGTPQVMVNGAPYNLSQVTTVSPPPVTTPNGAGSSTQTTN
jgi:flagellar basal-body rod modification protein FlgD